MDSGTKYWRLELSYWIEDCGFLNKEWRIVEPFYFVYLFAWGQIIGHLLVDDTNRYPPLFMILLFAPVAPWLVFILLSTFAGYVVIHYWVRKAKYLRKYMLGSNYFSPVPAILLILYLACQVIYSLNKIASQGLLFNYILLITRQ